MMLHLEVVGMSPRTPVPVKIGYLDRSASVTPVHRPSPLIPLSRRGLSRVIDEHPTGALEIIEKSQVPQEFSDKLVEAISSFHGTPVSSNRSSPTITEEIHSSSPSIVPGNWDTGNTTERSSVDSSYSWDEFDRQAAKTVQILFDEIDSVLYEKRFIKEEYIYNECQEWGAQFPHLRILGKQMLPPQDMGYQLIEGDVSRPSTTSSYGLMDVTDHDISTESQGLSISGRSVRAIVPPMEARSRTSGTPSSQHSEFSHLEEEVYAVEGEYEEIIAIDYKDIYEDSHSDSKKQLTPRRRRVGYPPITPNANLKDSIASSAFDCIWHEIISWIRPLMKKYASIVLDENKQLILPRNPSTSFSRTIRNESTPGPPSRENFVFKNQFLRAHTFTGVEPTRNLENILNIKKKEVLDKKKLNGDMTDSHLATRPNSSFTPSPNKLSNVSRNPSRGALGRSNRLAPISGIQEKSKTPNSPLMVQKIPVNSPAFGRLSSPPANNPRHNTLPPIGMGLELDVVNARLQKKTTASRASSAIEKDPRVPYRDRFIPTQEARPSTTQAMRSDTPTGMIRRESTPFSSHSAFNNMNSRRQSFSITGSGLQLASEISKLGNVPLEDQEGPLDDVIHSRNNQWSKTHSTFNNPYRRGRTRLSTGNVVRS